MPTARELTTLQRVALISTIPCFSMFSHDDRYALTLLLSEASYSLGERIVNEEDPVDSIFIIVNGTASVTRQGQNKQMELLASLGPGDTVGLNDKGFLKRTATVTANSDMIVLKLGVDQLFLFLQKNMHLLATMFTTSENMLRIQFVKSAMPFEILPSKRIQKLMDQVEEKMIPKGSVVFQKGMPIDTFCYVISGEIAVTVAADDHWIGQGGSFGEATIVMNDLYPVTGQAASDCRLLTLKHSLLSELQETEDNIKNTLTLLNQDASHWIPNPDLIFYSYLTLDQQNIVIIKNPQNNICYKLSETGFFVWQELSKGRDIKTIEATQSPHYLASLISKWMAAGFVHSDPGP